MIDELEDHVTNILVTGQGSLGYIFPLVFFTFHKIDLVAFIIPDTTVISPPTTSGHLSL